MDCPRFPRILRADRILPPCDQEIPRDPVLIWIETQVRQAIRDAVNRGSRKPFAWGGLSGYEQLEAMAKGLDQIRGINYESDYLLWLRTRVERVLAKNKTVAEDLKRAHQILLQVAQCLRYPPSAQELQFEEQISSQLVAQEITKLIEETRPRWESPKSPDQVTGGAEKTLGDYSVRSCCTVMIFLDYLKTIYNWRACSVVSVVTNDASVGINQPEN